MRASQLAKQHGHKLAPTGEAPRVPLGLVLLDRLFEIPARKKLQHLRKNAAYFVHRLSLLRLYWFFRNPIQPIRGSAFHSHSRFPGPPRWNHSAILDSNVVIYVRNVRVVDDSCIGCIDARDIRLARPVSRDVDVAGAKREPTYGGS